ncbi:Deoxymugineic acid synthase 1 [Seminavis robusta]|uniref:Deoxymugineic acid synthase 1 n=1 Tax=Seminavis robusta TaxID=568900 RepID=A0A9N8E6X9_9STRA|nr:Deoxymugineic acid synthase 1 [Seminavis robusta]|eukprot:Sro578_g169860.1 Deoxymugineic acid synthase 1 (380) ;mRNA; f:47490-48629
MSLISILCSRVLPALILVLALIVGWFASHEIPMGTFFATVIPLVQYHLPATIVGHGKMKGTPEVPDDMLPQPRLEKETFLELPNGDQMPQNGIGMCCRYSAYDNVLVERTTLWYLLQGGRHIDTAHLYLNHKPIGKAIKEAVKRGVPRSEIFITTKIFPTHIGYESTLKTAPKYLEELGVDYIDLVLVHFPVLFPPYITTNDCIKRGISATECRQETWKALSELREKGLFRNIGVSNFAVKHLEELEGVGAPIANNQIQYSPFTDPSVQETFQYCAKNNITITAYSPLGGMMEKDKAFAYSVLEEIATRHDRPVSQIMLRWAMQCGAAVIPGTGNPKHMRQNLDIYNFELSREEMATIDNLKHGKHAEKFMHIDVRAFD